MADDRVALILGRLDRPAEPRAEFAEELLERLIRELEPELLPRPARAPRRLFRRRLLPAFAMIAALLAGILLVLPRPPSALAVIQEARERFSSLPRFHAVLDVQVNDDASDPDFEVAFTRETWFRDERAWRWEILTSNHPGFGEPGEFTVADGTLEGGFVPSENLFEARPLEEVSDLLGASAVAELSPDAAFEAAGRTGTSPEEFFREKCKATDSSFLGRRTNLLTCTDGTRRLELQVDATTGFLLKTVDIDVVREVRSIEFDPVFGEDQFKVSAPAGARKRWTGSGAPPPEYAVPRGREVAATIPIGPSAGFSVEAVTPEALWVLHFAPESLETKILRVDPRTGEKSAITAPEEGGRIVDLEESSGSIWVLYDVGAQDRPSIRRLQRLDPATNSYVAPRIEIGEASSGGPRMTIAEGAVWVVGGEGRNLKVGRATVRAVTVSRVDLQAFEIQRFELPGLPMEIASEAGSLWISLEKVNDTDRSDDDYTIVRVDPRTHEILAEIPMSGQPNGLTAGLGAIWTRIGEPWVLVRIDAATHMVTRAKVGNGGGGIAIAAGSVWVANHDDDEVAKVDPSTLKVLARIKTGRGPGGLRAGLGSLWVSNADEGTVARIDV
jgi:YVTN family beta-propeller protein